MQLRFCKYHGTGNDFILLDNRVGDIYLNTETVAGLCHRRFGIGADGLMLLTQSAGADFGMVYYNADGRESSMCGNGGRCITAFAKRLGIIHDKATFTAIDGLHHADIDANGNVRLQMNDVTDIAHHTDYAVLDTGSPHYVLWTDDAAAAAVFEKGKAIRYSAAFALGGINVNFAERRSDGSLYVRTYERGVEDETMSCGTGVTAAAIAATAGETGTFVTPVKTPGGNLEISFKKTDAVNAISVVLSGPAAFVYEGVIVMPATVK